MKTAATVSGLLVPGTIRDTRGDGCNLLAEVELFGVPHHLVLVRVTWNDEIQEAFSEADRDLFDDISYLYDYEFRTVEVPGFEGQFVAVMHPYGA